MRLFAGVAPVLRFPAAFIRTRFLAQRLKTRADVESWQQRQINTWLKQAAPKVSFYAGMNAASLASLPVIDKSILMAGFERFNRLAMTAEDGFAIVAGAKAAPRGYSVGASTGTSGNRGLYVISDAERYEWLGVMLAKALPRFPFETAKIALILPLDSALYRTVDGIRVKLRFFDLRQGVERAARDAAAYGPDTVIAPPKVLRWLAERDARLQLRRVFSGAEVLDPIDRSVIEARYGVPVREIYMATEGLLGVGCERGVMHLAEDAVHFELEPVPGGLVSPIVTDFTRRCQIMARYRMNDLLRLLPGPCSCGSPLRAVAEIVGRRDDIFVLPTQAGAGSVTLTPDILRNAIAGADQRTGDFRLIQTGQNQLVLQLPPALPHDAGEAAKAALERLCHSLGAAPSIILDWSPVALPVSKLRRVERRWDAGKAVGG